MTQNIFSQNIFNEKLRYFINYEYNRKENNIEYINRKRKYFENGIRIDSK